MANSLTNLRQLTENSIVDDITLAETGARPFVYVCAFLSSMSSLLLGYECGVMAGAMGPIVDYMQLDVVEEGIIIGCVSIISVVGSLMVSFCSFN